MTVSTDTAIGFIGLGAMGGAMARNLIAAGYSVLGFDLDASKIAAAGVEASDSAADVARRSEVVLTSLTNSDVFVQVVERDLLPHVKPGQVLIDVGTVMPADVRRLAGKIAASGGVLLDVPVSGGVRGAAAGTLRMFAGGDEQQVQRVWPILEVLGDPATIVYCGPSGAGQIVKFVNQMAMGLSAAAHLESLALGVRAGIDAEILARAIGGDANWRARFNDIAQQVASGSGNDVGVKFGQLMYFITEARQLDLALPLTHALHDFCEAGERITQEANRLSPSFWHELLKGGE